MIPLRGTAPLKPLRGYVEVYLLIVDREADLAGYRALSVTKESLSSASKTMGTCVCTIQPCRGKIKV